jgi:hypothetical protein
MLRALLNGQSDVLLLVWKLIRASSLKTPFFLFDTDTLAAHA